MRKKSISEILFIFAIEEKIQMYNTFKTQTVLQRALLEQ